ncbi:MAG: hypothetical protein QM640_16910 [Niabella sp.]
MHYIPFEGMNDEQISFPAPLCEYNKNPVLLSAAGTAATYSTEAATHLEKGFHNSSSENSSLIKSVIR